MDGLRKAMKILTTHMRKRYALAKNDTLQIDNELFIFNYY